jgi:hypothetical protein
MTRSRVKNDFAVGLTTDSAGRLTTDHTITSGGSIVVGNDGSVTGAEGAQIDMRGNDGTATVYLFDVAGTPEVGRIFTVTDDTDLQIGQLGGTGGDVQFYASGSIKARFDSDGLKFGSDTAAANALDDYEEGSWTPQVASTGTASTASYTLQKGFYTKIGNRVFYNLYMQFNVTTQGTGLFYVTLPLTVAAGHMHTAASIAYQNVYTVASGFHLGCYTEQNANRIYFTQNNSLQAPPVSGARTLMVSGHYIA